MQSKHLSIYPSLIHYLSLFTNAENNKNKPSITRPISEAVTRVFTTRSKTFERQLVIDDEKGICRAWTHCFMKAGLGRHLTENYRTLVATDDEKNIIKERVE